MEVGDECEFHADWAEGWDTCVAFMARVVEDERSSELVGELADVEGAAERPDRVRGLSDPVGRLLGARGPHRRRPAGR
jgi:hypothetical protein